MLPYPVPCWMIIVGNAVIYRVNSPALYREKNRTDEFSIHLVTLKERVIASQR